MNLSERDQAVNWHPYTQMKTAGNAIPIVKGQGVYLFDDQGKKYIDAVSSWWVTLHGHSHPYIAQKVFEQLTTLEQVIFAGFTHEPAIRLSENLLKLLPENQRVAFTLHKLEGLSYQEVSDIMKTTVSSVESLMHRAKTNLQKKLEDYYKAKM